MIYWYWDPPCPCCSQAAWLSLPAPLTRASQGGEEKAGGRHACRGILAFKFISPCSQLSSIRYDPPEDHRHIPTHLRRLPGWEGVGCPCDPRRRPPSAPSLCPPRQVRLCLLCVGTSLVFGPLLGKSWRLYKVFTQRVPDKRVVSTQHLGRGGRQSPQAG